MTRLHRTSISLALITLAMTYSSNLHSFNLGNFSPCYIDDEEKNKFHGRRVCKKITQNINLGRTSEYIRRLGNGGYSGRVPYHIKRRQA